MKNKKDLISVSIEEMLGKECSTCVHRCGACHGKMYEKDRERKNLCPFVFLNGMKYSLFRIFI